MKKRLCFVVSLLLMITCTCPALASGFTFRKGISIGTSMIKVIANEKPLEHIWADDQLDMFYYVNQSYMGEKCTIAYSFTDGCVSQIHVWFDDPSTYDNIEAKLDADFGKPMKLNYLLDKEQFRVASVRFKNDVQVFHYISQTDMHVLSFSE